MTQRRLLAWLAIVVVALEAVIDSADAQQVIAPVRKRFMRPSHGAASRVSSWWPVMRGVVQSNMVPLTTAHAAGAAAEPWTPLCCRHLALCFFRACSPGLMCDEHP